MVVFQLIHYVPWTYLCSHLNVLTSSGIYQWLSARLWYFHANNWRHRSLAPSHHCVSYFFTVDFVNILCNHCYHYHWLRKFLSVFSDISLIFLLTTVLNFLPYFWLKRKAIYHFGFDVCHGFYLGKCLRGKPVNKNRAHAVVIIFCTVQCSNG